MSKSSDWKLAMQYPKGWIQLPMNGKDSPMAWAERAARENLGPEAPATTVAAKASHLVALTEAAREREDWYGLALFPPAAAGVIALLDIKAYVPDRRHRTITLDALEEIFASPSADTVGDAAITREDLPGGEAVRVRRTRAENADPAGQATLIEGVTYAIHPPGIDGAVELAMTWTRLHLGDELAEMADTIARTVRVRLV